MDSQHSTASNSNGQIQFNVQFEQFEKDKEYPRHIYAHKNGGFHLNALKDQDTRAIMLSVIKQVSSKLVQGELNLLALSKPVILTKPIPFIQCLCNEYIYFSTYLAMAAQTRDPLTRIQYISTAIIAGLHYNHSIFLSKVPMDSLVGETLQQEKEDGTKFYGEIIEANPPLCIFTIYGPNNLYILSGSMKVVAKMHPTMTSVNADAIGRRTITFKDGKVFEIGYPQAYIEGILNGDRIFYTTNEFQVHSKQDQLIARITFPFEPEGKVKKITKKLTSLIWTKEDQEYRDIFHVQIHKKLKVEFSTFNSKQIDNNEELFPLSSGRGSWLSYVSFDGNVLWRIDDKISPWLSTQKGETLLESDGHKREDGILIKEGKFDEAQMQKEINCEIFLKDQKSS